MTKTPAPKNSNSKLRVNRQAPAAAAKPEKRDNIFSKSRDTREDRGERQMKTTQSAQTFPHAR